MIQVVTEIIINAPIERCFDAARDIDLHTQTVWRHTREQAVSGVTTGLIGDGDTVTFEATHLGVRQRLTSEIAEYERPYRFVDQMLNGAFKSMRHEHSFTQLDNHTTRMTDTLKFEAPFGVLGWVAERIVLKRYMTAFLESRNRKLKMIVESGYVRPVYNDNSQNVNIQTNKNN
ncbi:SRPBCC family protein [Paenibacillus xylanexedens]|uniref:SRPBCC family protein n=1 Tax=Paenibacillus xylanexedens TaxID=528191 RepID=UPI0011A25672|nr:SRPBCC family protein [Paenibacillus xylanexedens]